MSVDRTYIDEVYDFEGTLGMHSQCGLRVVEKDGQTIFLVTELMEENPGTSITSACAKLATRLLQEHNVAPDKMVYIEHIPDMGSKLHHYQETFDLVTFTFDGEKLTQPDWKRISKEEADRILGG